MMWLWNNGLCAAFVSGAAFALAVVSFVNSDVPIGIVSLLSSAWMLLVAVVNGSNEHGGHNA